MTSWPADPGGAARRRRQRRHHPHRRGLAGAVGAEHAQHRALRDAQTDAVDRDRLAEVLHQVLGLDRRSSAHPSERTRGHRRSSTARFLDCTRAARSRRRDRRPRHAVRRHPGRRRALAERGPGHHHRGPRPQRRGQDDHPGDLRGLPPRPGRDRAGARPGPAPPAARPAPPDRRDAPGGRRLVGRPGRRDAPPRRPAARPPARRRPAGRAARAARVRADAVPPPLRRPEAAAGARPGGGGPARAGVRRRADRGHGPARPPDHLGPAARAPRQRGDRGAHHPPHGRGRAARRPHPHPRPRPDRGRRHAERAHEGRPHPRGRLPGRSPREGRDERAALARPARRPRAST